MGKLLTMYCPSCFKPYTTTEWGYNNDDDKFCPHCYEPLGRLLVLSHSYKVGKLAFSFRFTFDGCMVDDCMVYNVNNPTKWACNEQYTVGGSSYRLIQRAVNSIIQGVRRRVDYLNREIDRLGQEQRHIDSEQVSIVLSCRLSNRLDKLMIERDSLVGCQ